MPQGDKHQKYKNILERFNFQISEEKFLELVKSVEQLAMLIQQFESRSNKSQPKNNKKIK